MSGRVAGMVVVVVLVVLVLSTYLNWKRKWKWKKTKKRRKAVVVIYACAASRYANDTSPMTHLYPLSVTHFSPTDWYFRQRKHSKEVIIPRGGMLFRGG